MREKANPLRSLVTTTSVHVFNHPRETYVQESDLAFEVVNLLLQGAAAVPPPVEANRPGHEVDGHDKAQGEDRVLRLPLVLLEDVHAGQREEGDPHDPEETAAQHVQEIEEEPKEEGHKPIGKQDGTDQQKGTGGVIGDCSGAEVVSQVGG